MSVRDYLLQTQEIKDNAKDFKELKEIIQDIANFHILRNHSIKRIQIELKIEYE